jgi:hypothetical protein
VLSSERGQEFVSVDQQEKVALGLLGFKAKQDRETAAAWKEWIKSDRTSPMPDVDLTAREAGEMLNAYFSNGRRWLDKVVEMPKEKKRETAAADSWEELQRFIGWARDEAISLANMLNDGVKLPCSPSELARFVKQAKKELSSDLDALLKAANAVDADRVVSEQ